MTLEQALDRAYKGGPTTTPRSSACAPPRPRAPRSSAVASAVGAPQRRRRRIGLALADATAHAPRSPARSTCRSSSGGRRTRASSRADADLRARGLEADDSKRASTTTYAPRFSISRPLDRAAPGGHQRARARDAAAPAGARSIRRRRRQQHRSDAGAGIRGARDRAVHRRAIRLQPGESGPRGPLGAAEDGRRANILGGPR